jgi:hypothetical protein
MRGKTACSYTKEPPEDGLENKVQWNIFSPVFELIFLSQANEW